MIDEKWGSVFLYLLPLRAEKAWDAGFSSAFFWRKLSALSGRSDSFSEIGWDCSDVFARAVQQILVVGKLL